MRGLLAVTELEPFSNFLRGEGTSGSGDRRESGRTHRVSQYNALKVRILKQIWLKCATKNALIGHLF